MQLSQNLLWFALFAIPSQEAAAQEMAYLLEGTSAGDHGRAVADAGDFDGDGHDDVVVGAPFHSENGAILGAVTVYSGRTGEIIWQRFGSNAFDAFGWSVDGIGDNDGDGKGDIIVSAPLEDHPNGSSNVGRVYLFTINSLNPHYSVLSSQVAGQFGSKVLGIGDLNGDGVGEWAMCSHKLDSFGLTDNGVLQVRDGASKALLWSKSGGEDGEQFSFSMDVMRATGAEATSRLIVGSPRYDGFGTDRGKATLYDGFGNVMNTLFGTINNAWLGYAVAGAGDVDSDGSADYAVSSPFVDLLGVGVDAGSVRVYTSIGTTLLFGVYGTHAGNQLGQSISGFGDFNGDGVDDILIGSPNYTPGIGVGFGEARVVSGTNGSTLKSYVGSAGERQGASVSSAGDLNNDGHPDVIFGAYEGASGLGSAQVHLSQVSAPIEYCSAKVNSQGCTPQISWEGIPSTSIADSFHVSATNVLNNKIGLLLWSRSMGSIPFMGGTLCASGPITRTTPSSSGGNAGAADCSGSYSFHFSHAYMGSEFILPGDTIFAQYWSRDPASSFGVGLTNAVSFVAVH